MGVWRPLKCDSLRGKRSKRGPKSEEIPSPPQGVGGKTDVRVYRDTQETGVIFQPNTNTPQESGECPNAANIPIESTNLFLRTGEGVRVSIVPLRAGIGPIRGGVLNAREPGNREMH